ncbi:MAG TPA: exopolysaccharide biosynthesis polyprenyl glycosylphosphotransferase [Acetobacteraceae bacterium]|nr:exopolysaccharide biosynthesis polyprenyl glycosylphosphotransferase [Acetobacteraceae bacterium]
MVADGTVLLAAGGIAWLFLAASPRPLTWLQSLTVALVMTISFVWVMRWLNLYRVERYSRILRSLLEVACGFVPAAIAGGVILAAFAPRIWSQCDWIVSWFLFIFVGLLLERQVARLLLTIVRQRGLLRRRVVVVGAGPKCDEIVQRLRQPRFSCDHHLVGVFDPQFNRSWRGDGGSTPDPSRVPDLVYYAQNYAIDLVVIAVSWDRSSELFDLIRGLQWISADVVVPFETAGLRPQFVPPMRFIGSPTLQVMHRPFRGSQALVKTIEDYTVAVAALIVASPWMLLAALAIRFTDGTPVLFRQPRSGFNNKEFLIYKFRTMSIDNSDDGSRGTMRGNQRITRVGRFLRSTSIDELPQLFNVLRGDMSIVGPRPHVPNMLVEGGVYSEVVRQYAARHRIKPGITGWAQINGMRGGIDTMDKANRGADLDLYYVANWSLRLDITIMLKTLFRGMAGRNVF